ncbi:hypothetical protein FRC00_011290 [Tulasnella sp. 408]|nr:hypothetical protein FRC00_011290 [Tulasnella sp. 408]
MSQNPTVTERANANDEDCHGVIDVPEPAQRPDLADHVSTKPLEMQYSELVAIHFGSFTLSRGPLMSRRNAKECIKYLWTLTIQLLPYDGPVQPPPIAAHNISHALSFAKALINRGKAVARLLVIADFDPLTRIYSDDDMNFLCSNPSEVCAEDTISIRFALDEFNTGAYLKLSFTEWSQEHSSAYLERIWNFAAEIEGGAYLDSVQRALAEQLRFPATPTSSVTSLALMKKSNSNNKTDTTPSTAQAGGESKSKSKGKMGDSNAAADTNTEPQASTQAQNNRPKRAGAAKALSNGENLPNHPQPQTTSLVTASVKKNTATKKGSAQAAKENVPPVPAATASKPKKLSAAERREQQLNAADQAALEQRIKELEAQNASQQVAFERLKRQNKRLNHRATLHASSTADAKTDQTIGEPDTAQYNLREEMGLADDSKTYSRVQRTVRDLSRRVLDFEQSWKNQDAIAISDLFRAAAEKEPFLRRFRGNWATAKLAKMYLRNSRSYAANVDIPESGVAKRRARTTKKGAAEAGLPPPALKKKKKSAQPEESAPAPPEETGNEASTSALPNAPNPSSTTTNTKSQNGKIQSQGRSFNSERTSTNTIHPPRKLDRTGITGPSATMSGPNMSGMVSSSLHYSKTTELTIPDSLCQNLAIKVDDFERLFKPGTSKCALWVNQNFC